MLVYDIAIPNISLESRESSQGNFLAFDVQRTSELEYIGHD